MGVELARLVLIPDPGDRWLAVTATIAEVLPVVAVRPPRRAADAEVSRLAARLRDRGTVLLVQGPWPQAEASIGIGESRWSGLGQGHGYLAGREVTVTVTSRRTPVARRGRVMLPGADGAVSAARPPRPGDADARLPAPRGGGLTCDPEHRCEAWCCGFPTGPSPRWRASGRSRWMPVRPSP